MPVKDVHDLQSTRNHWGVDRHTGRSHRPIVIANFNCRGSLVCNAWYVMNPSEPYQVTSLNLTGSTDTVCLLEPLSQIIDVHRHFWIDSQDYVQIIHGNSM